MVSPLNEFWDEFWGCSVGHMFSHISDKDLVFHYHPELQQVPRYLYRGSAPPIEASYEGENVGVHQWGYWPELDSPSSEYPQGCIEGRDSIRVPYPKPTNSSARTCLKKCVSNPSDHSKMVQGHSINNAMKFQFILLLSMNLFFLTLFSTVVNIFKIHFVFIILFNQGGDQTWKTRKWSRISLLNLKLFCWVENS